MRKRRGAGGGKETLAEGSRYWWEGGRRGEGRDVCTLCSPVVDQADFLW